MSEQKAFIEEFRKKGFGLDDAGKPSGMPEHARSSFEEALAIVSKDLYSDDLHFVYELIQNAQDNGYKDGVTPNLKFLLLKEDPTESGDSEGCLCVINNEVGFSETDITSICSVGKSPKKLRKVEGFIGEKGIGFKSVFKVSNLPHIFSNGFHFRLLGEDKLTGLSYIIPYWIEDVPDIARENEDSTCILLPLQKGKYQEIEKSLKKHKPEVTLFLDKLRRVEIQIPSENYKAIFEERIENGILTLSSTIGDSEPSKQEFLISRKTVQVPNDLREEKREGVKERTISVAFPLQKYKSLSVFAYLPTEMRSGLPFIINADFLLAANRESINKTEWNTWLFKELASFVAAEIVRIARDNIVGSLVYRFIPIPTANDEAGGRFSSVAKDVVSQLKPEAFVRDTAGTLYTADVVRRVTKDFRELFSHADHQVQWLSVDLNKYADQLSQVGVKALSKEEEEAYYLQTKFVEHQDDDWFIKYYQYLGQLKNRSPDSYPIIPLDKGGLATVESSSTYYPIEADESHVEIEGHFFPAIQTIRASLFEAIASRGDSAKIFANIDLKPFSFSDYFFEIVLPLVAERAETASLSDKKSLIEFVLRWWEKLEVDDNLWVSDHGLPVLLDGGVLALTKDIEHQLVYPEGFFDDGGWELIFISDEEKAEFSILDYWYSQLTKDEVLEDYFSKAEVREFPEPIFCEQEGRFRLQSVPSEYKNYCAALNDQFFDDFNKYQATAGHVKKVEFPMQPGAFWKADIITDEQYGYLVRYFNYLFSSSYDGKSIQTQVAWYRYGPNTRYVISAIEFQLKNNSWLRTNRGFYHPSECFYDDPNLRRIFGDDLPYVSAPVSTELLDKLGVRRDAETETIVDYLKHISGSASASKEAMAGIYNALKERKDLDQASFAENQLIFIPEVEGKSAQWCSIAEVIWDDISDITDDSTFESLEPHYPDSLKYFFVNKLGVKESIDANSYADLWLNLQAKPRLNDRDLKLYNKAFQNVRLAVRQKEKAEWLLEFKKSAKLYADSQRWVSPHDENVAFLPDLASLREEFSGKVPFIRRIDDYSYEWMQPLVEYLDFECFSEVVEEELITTEVRSLTHENKYLSDFTIKLLVRLIANKVSEGREIVERLKASGTLAALLNFRETEVDQIRVKLYIPHTEISTVTSNHSVFLNFNEKLLYIKRGVDSEDVKDELERLIINRVLQDISSRQEREAFEDSVSKILGVVTEARFKKLSAKKPDWHIPRDILTFIDRLIKDRPPHDLALKFEKESSPEEHDTLFGSESDAAELGDSSSAGQATSKEAGKPVDNFSGAGSENDAEHTEGDDELGEDIFGRQGNSEQGGNRGTGSTRSSVTSTSRDTNQGKGSAPNVKGKSSRSNNVASHVNQARRNKLRSYVVSDLIDSHNDNDAEQSEEQKEYRRKLGEKAELIVEEDLKAKGFDAVRMPEGNRGYDIQATNPETGELLFFEVKGDSHAWSDKGVGISRPQYDKGGKEGTSFYLAVVDNLSTVPSSPYYIRDPISYITEYRFDSGWAELACPMKLLTANDGGKSVLDRLLAFTEDPNCQAILRYCDEMAFPFPEIGAELQDDDGSVVLENLELFWENERIIVFIDSDDVNEAAEFKNDWEIFLATDEARIRKALDKLFGEAS